MQFKLQFGLFAAMLAAAVSGAAVPEVEPTITDIQPAILISERDLSARASPVVTICKDKNFGKCGTFSGDANVCYNLSSDWNDQASSVRSVPGYFCYIYQDFNCGGFRGGPVQDDNAHNDLGAVGWNDKTSSFLCIRK